MYGQLLFLFFLCSLSSIELRYLEVVSLFDITISFAFYVLLFKIDIPYLRYSKTNMVLFIYDKSIPFKSNVF